MNKRTRLKRLKQLRHMMKNHDNIFPKVAFNIGFWEKRKMDLFSISKHMFCDDGQQKKAADCGTAACVLGSACQYDKFKKQGLRMKRDGYGGRIPYFKSGAEEIEAGREFFGITDYESFYLFMPDEYSMYEATGPKEVIKHIDVLIRRYEKKMKRVS